MTPHEVISLKITELNQLLLDEHPKMPSLLADIHRGLQQDPDIITLLEPAQRAIIVSGLSKQTQTTIMTSILKAPTTKKLKNISVDDI